MCRCRNNPTNARIIVVIADAIAALFHFVIVFAINTANAAQR
jgi:hypothetical protein